MKYLPQNFTLTLDNLSTEVTELLESSSRILILVTGGCILAWWIASANAWFSRMDLAVNLTPLLVLASCAAALWLLPRQFLLAHTVWLLGLTATITLGIFILQEPVIGFLYILLPLMAAITVDWSAGVVAELIVIGLIIWLSGNTYIPAISRSYCLVITFGGAFAGLIGCVAMRTLLITTEWSLRYGRQMAAVTNEVREQRMETEQVREDLVHANQELARLSDRLKVMYQVAEEARQAKERFVANVSHELRTPLNMIIGFSEVITQSPEVYGIRLPPPLMSDIVTIQRNSQHLSRLVNDVLDLSQIEAGKMILAKEWLSVPEIANEAVLAIQPLFKSKTLFLEAEYAPDLPAVFCDGTRIRQVILNLLSNAGRFTREGGARIKVWRDEHSVLVSVTDTGPGIPPESQVRLFEPFQQLDASIRRQHGGSGLGLSISKQLIELHEGKMELESQPGVGTTVTFSLPHEGSLSAAPVGSPGALRWFSPHNDLTYRLRTRKFKAPVPTVIPRFIILEAGDTLWRLLQHYLDQAELVSVASFEEAMHELSRSPAQGLIINSPSPEEYLAGQITNLPFGTPAYHCWIPGEDEAIKRLGVVAYLIKPISQESLQNNLELLGERVRNILLVDDEPEVLRLFTRFLTSMNRGYRVLRATDGQKALELLRQRRPDVMLLDLSMPGMDGFQVLKEKASDPDIQGIPVIITSARDPMGMPVVGDTITVKKSGGFSVPHLISCIQAISTVLSPIGSPSVPTGDLG